MIMTNFLTFLVYFSSNILIKQPFYKLRYIVDD